MDDETDREAADPTEEPPPRVLELRVHGVNNTTPYALLDLPADGVQLVAGDKLGAFWEPTPAARAAAAEGQRGHVPDRVRREAYSWGGMVRSVPNAGGMGIGGVTAGALARVVYALMLPYSLGNAVQWTRRLAVGTGRAGSRKATAGLARLFGLLLTLLFTATVVTLAVDIGAVQCGADASLCGPLAGILAPLEEWTAGARLALMSLVPVLAVVLLWVLSTVSRLRYDVLPGMEKGKDALTDAGPDAVLSQPGFWSNRITRHLARTHLAAAIFLTAGFAGAQASMGWQTTCSRLPISAACLGSALDDPWFLWYAGCAFACVVGLLGTVAAACALPTMTITTEEELDNLWPNAVTNGLLWISGLAFVAIIAPLALAPEQDDDATRLFGAGMTPVVIVGIAALIAFSGLWWRAGKGWADRAQTAWHGRGPAVFMTLSLALASATSAIVVVTVGDWLNGSKGPATLLGWEEPATGDAPGRVNLAWTDATTGAQGETSIGAAVADPGGIEISSSFVALGTAITIGLLVTVVLLSRALTRRRDVTDRARAWLAPTTEAGLRVPDGGVLPPSRRSLLRRVIAARTQAARLHLAEPIVGVLATVLAIAGVLGITWTLWAYTGEGRELWTLLGPALVPLSVNILDVAMASLGWIGLTLVVVLASGATTGGTRPLGIVWDIACYLPRSGHPFGPPCYAERAVPEIAGHLNAWLTEPDHEDRTAVLSAHSMGAVLSVSSLALLASSPATRGILPRISLLTFGVQLRAYFGRMLPELLGPAVLGTAPSRAPRLAGADPWTTDFDAAGGASSRPPAMTDGTDADPDDIDDGLGRLGGSLLPTGQSVRWVNLWRLTDYLGFPAADPVKYDADGRISNRIDRFATELDRSGYMADVATHGEYYRVPDYTDALEDLRDRLETEFPARP